jgi:hypothetical protein
MYVMLLLLYTVTMIIFIMTECPQGSLVGIKYLNLYPNKFGELPRLLAREVEALVNSKSIQTVIVIYPKHRRKS